MAEARNGESVIVPAVYAQVEAERTRQREKGYDESHDDGHTLGELATLINQRALAVRVKDGLAGLNRLQQDKRMFVQIAAIAVAAIEKLEREPGGKL